MKTRESVILFYGIMGKTTMNKLGRTVKLFRYGQREQNTIEMV